MTSLRTLSVRLLLSSTAALALLVGGGSMSAGLQAQEPTLTAERVVDWATSRSIPLTAKVGAVSIKSVEFSDRGRATAGGIGGLVRGSASDTTTTLRAHFLAENATADEWQVTFTLEFLDRDGKLIDRASRKSSWEGEAKPTDLDHVILQYVVPSISQVRIRMEAKLD
jgi:hypothetical protein